MADYLEKLPDFVDRIRSMKDIIITNIVLIGQTPAPTFKEKKRTQVFMDRLAEFQVDECTTDGYRNPIGIIRGTSQDKPPIFLVAHLDTFFDRDIVYNFRVRKNSITGPGILDNSVGVGVLVSMPEIFRQLDLHFASDIVIAGVIQSLGKGNLRGVRHLVKTWATPVRAAICVEGIEIGRLNYYSDGMIRGEIECNFSKDKKIIHKFRPNAIIVLNEVINEILKLRMPQRPRSRIVIGRFSGGINHGKIAYNANLGFEIRSHSKGMVQSILNDIKNIVASIGHENEVELNLKIISNMSPAKLLYTHPLVTSTVNVMNHLGITPFSKATESAQSIFLSNKIPTITLGLTRGENHYQENARMEIEPMFKGIAQIIGALMAIDSGVCDDE
jgi:acetylornithine deacetylase/succinyl-diaminopimelate desuccinylase-like protein